jgi:hypothetical protein
VSRFVALIILTIAFVPAAVLGALPLVAPVVGVLVICSMLLGARAPVVEPVADAQVSPTP